VWDKPFDKPERIIYHKPVNNSQVYDMKYDKKSITDILRSPQTVFTFKDISLIWGETDLNATMTGVYYYVKKGQLYRIRKGVYAKDKNYDRLEMATKIYTPSYVSLETVFRQAGMTFQHYDSIFVAARRTGEITADGQKIVFQKLKDHVLTNQAGLENKGNYFVATPERAFLDRLYLNRRYYFDNLDGLNWEKVFELLPIYDNKQLSKRVQAQKEAFDKKAKS
jgi:hypothetical protein